MALVGKPEGAARATDTTAPYVHLCELATGGMARVDVVVRREGSFTRLYAMKRLLPHLHHDEAVRAMFVDEAKYAGLLRHANVVSVLDVGQDAHGPYLVMDYVDGISLSDLMRHVSKERLEFPLQLALRIARQMASGLHAAHELHGPDGQALNLVHRDVSPQNVLVGFDGTVRLTDFGIAKALGQSSRTATGVLKGKFGYMSPEQLRFDEPDRRSDLFALGVVLYELLAGRRLYANRSGMEGPKRILQEPPPDITDDRPDTPAEVVALLFDLLAKEPDQRPETALDVARRLEEAITQLSAEEGAYDLAEYLASLFGERQRQRAEAIREKLAALPEDGISASRLIPASSGGPSLASTEVIVPTKPRRRVWGVLAVAGVLAAAAAALFLRPESRTQATALTSEAPPPVSTVSLRIESSPPGAAVFIDDTSRGDTPLELQLNRGADPLSLRLEKPGYVPIHDSVTATESQRMRFALVASADSGSPPKTKKPAGPPTSRARRPPRPPPAPTATARPAPSSGGFQIWR